MLVPVVLSVPGPETERYLVRKLEVEQNPSRLSRYLVVAQGLGLQNAEIERQASILLGASRDPAVRVAAAELVADSKAPGAETALRQAVGREPDARVRDYLTQLLATRHPPAEGFLLKAAGEGGLRGGDILLTLNGRRIASLEQMAREAGAGRDPASNAPLHLSVYRNGQVVEMRTTSREMLPLLGGLAGEYVVPDDKR